MEKTLARVPQRKRIHHSALVVSLMSCLLLASACSLPVTVKRGDPETVQRELTGYVLTTGEPSMVSENTLRRYFLTERFEDYPEHALAELHTAVIQDDNQDALFVLSELSFYHARESGKQPYYLAAAVYAYAYLFPAGAGTPPNPIDPRLRAACELYHRGLSEAFESEDGKKVEVRAGVYSLPFGSLTVTFDESQLRWGGDRLLTDFISAADLQITGLNNRYRRPGIGAPLVASTVPLNTAGGEHVLVAAHVKVSTNLFLRIEQPKQDLASGHLRAALELRTDTDADSVRVDNRDLPLEYEPTATVAYQLSQSTIWETEFAGFFTGDLLHIEKITN